MSQTSLAFCFRISTQSISIILRQTMKLLIKKLAQDYLPKPTTEKLIEVGKEFLDQWNFPHCCGAVDGKHVRIKAPAKSGSLYYNYKNFFSSVLLAIVDAKYKFIAVDIGVPGSQSDAGILDSSPIGNLFGENGILPAPSNVNGYTKELPHVIIGDVPGDNLDPSSAIFNYRLSRARRVVENAFGILNAKWRIFSTQINANNDLVNLIVMCSVILHNFLIVRSDDSAINEDGDPQVGFLDLGWRGGRNHSNRAKEIRHDFAEYFISDVGCLPGQGSYTLRGYV